MSTPVTGQWTPPWSSSSTTTGSSSSTGNNPWGAPPMFGTGNGTGSAGLDFANHLNTITAPVLSSTSSYLANPNQGGATGSGATGTGGPAAPRLTFPDGMSTDGGKTTKSGLTMDQVNDMLGQPAGSPVNAQQIQALTQQLQQDPSKISKTSDKAKAAVDAVTSDPNKMSDLTSFNTYMQSPATGGGKTVTNVSDITSKPDKDGKGGSGITADQICTLAGAPAGTPISEAMLKAANAAILKDSSKLNGLDKDKVLADLSNIDKQKLDGSGDLSSKESKNAVDASKFSDNRAILDTLENGKDKNGINYKEILSMASNQASNNSDGVWTQNDACQDHSALVISQQGIDKVAENKDGKYPQDLVDACKAMKQSPELQKKLFGDDNKARIDGNSRSNNEVLDLMNDSSVNSIKSVVSSGNSGSSGSSGS